jgi:2-keto-4-pentenoate hydratase/2-oxohepta-3-ene-1,7-dioic acid hydratase in catechol pathway
LVARLGKKLRYTAPRAPREHRTSPAQEVLHAGDVVECEIAGIGTLRNTIVAA